LRYRGGWGRNLTEGPNFVNLGSRWTEFLKRKQDWDLTGNGVNHPIDFGHRVFAQVLSTLLFPPVDVKN